MSTLPAAGRQSIVISQSSLIKKMLHLMPLMLLLLLLQAVSQNQKGGALAVSVQRLQVPDLVVVDSMPRPRPELRTPFGHPAASAPLSQRQPEAASLINSLEPQVTFECLISYERRRDKNLIVKWHHDERNEPIYQWIPELNKRPNIAPQYRAFIQPLNQTAPVESGATNRTTIEASFKLVRPTKELGGKYTCSAISSQNDDSKSKKMIVYTPPRSFTFNATRANLGALFASHRDRLIQLTQPTAAVGASSSNLPAAYRMRGLEQQQQRPGPPAPSTISPQMLSTIDYVNVNRATQASSWPAISSGLASSRARSGLKLVCDIDQVFPVPEVSIFRLAGKLDGQPAAHADKLAKLDTRIERDPLTGLFHVQVVSVLDDDELHTIRQNQLMMLQMMNAAAPAPSGPGGSPMAPHSAQEPEIYFECLIALTNLELSRYADNRRSLIYRPAGHSANSLQGSAQVDERNSRLLERPPASRAATLTNAGSTLVWTALALPLQLLARRMNHP